jgi:hypothetical protein
MSLFEKGRARSGGRAKGTRNKISQRFLEDFAAEWEAKGAECLKIMATEHPSDFVKVAAGLLPKEMEITDSRLQDISDQELDAIIEHVRTQLSIARGVTRESDGREEPQIH